MWLAEKWRRHGGSVIGVVNLTKDMANGGSKNLALKTPKKRA